MHSHIPPRLKAARERAVARLRDRTVGEHGAFDIASIIVGVVLLGILVGGIITTTQGLVPWAQDKSTKQDLSAIVTAEQVYKAASTDQYGKTSATFGTLTELKTAPASLLPSDVVASSAFALDADAGNYWAVKKGRSGKWFGVNEEESNPLEIAPAPAATAVASDVLTAYKTANP